VLKSACCSVFFVLFFCFFVFPMMRTGTNAVWVDSIGYCLRQDMCSRNSRLVCIQTSHSICGFVLSIGAMRRRLFHDQYYCISIIVTVLSEIIVLHPS